MGIEDDPNNNFSGGYMGNPRLKKAGEQVEWSPELAQEFIKCASDPIYFAERYVRIIDIDKGSVTIKLRQYQKDIIETMFSNRKMVVNSGRQQGKTTTAVCAILHYIIFNKEKLVALLANKGDTAREILDRIQFAYQELPKWLQQGVLEWNKGSLKLENGCKVIAAASSSSAIRGKSVAYLYLDEAAHIENFEEFWASVYPTISSGKESKVLMTSTPNQLNHFYKICTDAQKITDPNSNIGENGFIYKEIKWDEVEGRDEAWKQQELAALNGNIDKFRQEYECSFIGSANNLIGSEALFNMAYHAPLISAGPLKQYEKPLLHHKYILVADVSRGKGIDYSAFSIIDITDMPYKQVCTYNNNEITPVDYAIVIEKIAKEYNMAHVLVEINDIGGQVSDILALDYGYENMVQTKTKGRAGKDVSGGFGRNVDRGVRTSKNVKAQGCGNLKLMIEQQQLLIHDKETINQLKRFVRKGDSYEADKGAHDDLVMTLVLFAWVVTRQYFTDLTEVNTLYRLRNNTDEEIDNMMLPFFFADENGFGDAMSTWEIV